MILCTQTMWQKQINKIFKFNVIFWLVSIRYKFLLKGVFENCKTWSFGYLATSFMFMCRLIVYTKIFCFIKTNTTLFLLQQFKTFKKLVTRLKVIKDNYWNMSRWQLPLAVKTVFSLNFLNFKTLALLHKNFRNLENAMIVLCKSVVLKCEYVSCKPSKLRVKPSLNSDLCQSAHCFIFANETK